MSVVSMKKIWLCGLEPEKEELLSFLQKKRLFHVRQEDSPSLSLPDMREAEQAAEKKGQLAEQALKILDQYAPGGGGLFASFSGATEKTYAEWRAEREKQAGTVADAQAIVDAGKKLAEEQAALLRAQMLAEGMKPWESFDRPLNTEETKSCRVFLGTLPGQYTEASFKAMLAQEAPKAEAYEIEMLEAEASQTALVLLCLKEEAPALEEALRKQGFARPQIQTSQTPAELLAELAAQQKEAEEKAKEAEAFLRASGDKRAALQFLSDDARLEKDRFAAMAAAERSREVFFMTGYVPEKKAEAFRKELEERFTCSVEFCPPDEDDAPVLLKNNRFSTPTESVVESYGLPGKGEIDPTAIMSFFYYFLFGLMLSDAGYGLLMVIGCAVLLKKFPKMAPNTKKMFTMFFWCGVSTTIWGFLFGGFFGDVFDVVAHTFLGVPADKAVFPAPWFAPLDEPMRLLIYSFLFGVIHLFVGLGIKGYQLLKQKQVMAFVGSVLSWYLFLIGLILMLVPSDLFASISGSKITFPDPVPLIAKILAIAGALGLLLFAAYDQKNFGLRLALGAYEIYGVTGWLSDVLSYSRLLALGLATGVIASVINKMASMFGSGPVGVILFIIIFLVGHTLNMAINLLGAYVHTNRLQYVEFFGKFYDGGGEAYSPLSADTTKYYHMEEN